MLSVGLSANGLEDRIGTGWEGWECEQHLLEDRISTGWEGEQHLLEDRISTGWEVSSTF